MKVDKSKLLGVVQGFRDVPMLVVGDLLLDHYIWGSVDRISPEAPVVVVAVTEENKRLGGAGNVANNLVSLGAKASICGAVGDDEAGQQMVELFAEKGVETEGILVDSSRPTTQKTRVIAHAQQVVRVDREVAEPLAENHQKEMGARVSASLKQARGVIVSDYAKGAICPAVFDALHGRSKTGPAAGAVLVDPKAPNFSMYRSATVIKPNRKEAEESSGMRIKKRSDAIAAGRKLLTVWDTEMVLITLGEMGMVLVAREDEQHAPVEVDTVARDVYDVSGAGDTVSAVFSLSLAAGASTSDAAVLANIAAGVVVGEVGTAVVSVDSLNSAIERFE